MTTHPEAHTSRPMAPQTGMARHLAIWALVIAALIVLPMLFPSRSSVGTMNQIGIMVIFALSYNVLLGQTGLLSLGHGMFFGVAGFTVIHVINAFASIKAPVPLILVPLFGGAASFVLALIFGWTATLRGGTAFAMITLGLGEMIAASTSIFKGFFGGEEGVTTDRTGLMRLFGLNFGSQTQVYYLILGWGIISAIGMYFLTRTPFGQMATAVRENQDRVEFLGYRPQVIRYLAFCFAAFFAGISGSLAAINYEIMTAANVSGLQSALVLLITFIGGVNHFVGPIIGAIVISFMQIWLSDITPGWQLYFGLMFILVVMYAPSGLAGIIHAQIRLLPRGGIVSALPSYVLIAIPLLMLAFGAIMLIELAYQAGLKASEGHIAHVFGVALDTQSLLAWLASALIFVVGVGGLVYALPIASQAYARALKVAEGREVAP